MPSQAERTGTASGDTIGVLRAAAALYAALFAFAFVAAPYSCEWGLTAYLWLGAAGLLASLALPFAFYGSSSLGRCVIWGSSLAGMALLAWTAGALAANVRIACPPL